MGISFDEVLFPAGISQGAVGGPRFSTSVLGLSSGFEHRNQNWVKRRGEWDVATGLRTAVQAEALLDFFHGRRGKAYGFRFKDWSDYRVPRWISVPGDLGGFPVWFVTDGATPSFQLTKIYGDVVRSYTRLIQKPATLALDPTATPVTLFNNAVAMTAGVDFTVDPTTGIVTLSDTLTATVGNSIAGYTEFHVPARFDTDDMKITTTTTDNYAWGPIPIVEIRDIT
jgi:uncharacterized protein (TIGR02217 family)